MMQKHKVLLIEDDENLQGAMELMLVQGGYEFYGALNGEAGLAMLAECEPDLLLLDVMLPGISGFDLCRMVREQGSKIPVVFLTAKSDIVDKGIGFRSGGDDYVTKPFDSAELLLRIEAHIRRYRETIDQDASAKEEEVALIGDLEIRFAQRQVLVKGVPADLTAKEYEIVAFLAKHPGRPFMRGEIQGHIWGESDINIKTSSITVLVRKIREKIEERPSEPKYLLTVQGFGYKLASVESFGQEH